MSAPTAHRELAVAATPVDRRSPLPAWAQIERDLQTLIDQELPSGSQLPTENEMATIYGVSRITIRQALSSLSERGYVARRQGTGTFVAERTRLVQHDLGLLTPWRDRFRAAGEQAESIELETAGPEREPFDLTRELRLDERSLARRHFRRLHLVNQRPIGLTDSWVVGRSAAALPAGPLIDGSLSKTLLDAGIVADHLEHFLEVRSVNAFESDLLESGPDAQVFVDWSIARAADELVETTRTVWLGARVRMHYTS